MANMLHVNDNSTVNALNAYALSKIESTTSPKCVGCGAESDVDGDWYFRVKGGAVEADSIKCARCRDPALDVKLPDAKCNLKSVLDAVRREGRLVLPADAGDEAAALLRRYLGRGERNYEIEPTAVSRTRHGYKLKASYAEYYRLIRALIEYTVEFLSRDYDGNNFEEFTKTLLRLIESVLDDFVFDDQPYKLWAYRSAKLAQKHGKRVEIESPELVARLKHVRDELQRRAAKSDAVALADLSVSVKKAINAAFATHNDVVDANDDADDNDRRLKAQRREAIVAGCLASAQYNVDDFFDE